MKIDNSLNPNCSEAVFRFYTLEPEKIQTILQAIANDIDASTGFAEHKGQKVPLLKTAEEYDSNYSGKPSYSNMYETLGGETKQVMTEEEARKKSYPKGSLLKACAGLGDNEAVITIEKEKGSFVLNIGNNDISGDNRDWVEIVKSLGIKVVEAEGKDKEAKELNEKYARDCCCGVTFFE